MSTSPQVVVRGEAVLTVPPEVADVVATVRVHARDRQTALERCSARLADVTAVVAAAGEVVETSDTGSAAVYEEHDEHGAGRPVAMVETRLVLARPDAAGEVVAALGALDDVHVAGPWWRLRPDGPAFEEARIAAVQDAVRRARRYAEAFGAEITGLVEVADAGLSGGGAPRFGEAVAGVAVLEHSGPGLDLTPRDQRVHGSVEVRFTMSPPDVEVFRR
jgi:uncharacterized protein YggE